MFCLYDRHDDATDPLMDEEFTLRPLACFKSFDEAFNIPEESVPTVQGLNPRGIPRRILCLSHHKVDVDPHPLGLPRRSGRFGVAGVFHCDNRTFPGGAELWNYGHDEVEKYRAGLPSNVPDPEPLT
jgi:hypothetical protein